MIDMILRPLVEHPKRVWIVTTLTLLVGLVFAWPAVDYYFAAVEHRSKLESDLQEGESLAGKLDMYKAQLDKKRLVLAELDSRTVKPAEMEQFRDQVTAWVKESGCKLRRVKLGDPQYRVWYEEDSPLEVRARTEKDKKSPFQLRNQQLNLLVSGPMDKVSDFLGKLSEQEKLLHTGNFQLRRSTEDPSVVEMDLDLIFFDLVQGESQKG